MKLCSTLKPAHAGLCILMAASMASAVLVQPYNYLLEDEPPAGHNGQLEGSNEQASDKDIMSIIGERLARLRFARMLMDEQEDAAQQHFSQEMADMIQRDQQEQAAAANGKQAGQASEQQSLSSSVASMLLNVAQAAASAAGNSAEGAEGAAHERNPEQGQHSAATGNSQGQQMSARGSIMELDTSPSSSSGASSGSMPSKADLKSGPLWYNPKETIPVLKISSMATPSKYKKVYFRSEKKLVDGAFHSLPSSEQNEKKSLMKTFNSGVQRRSSRGTSSSVAPPSILQDGVIDFLKKFRDVYIQTRPASGLSSSSASSFASNFMSAAASSPLAAVLAPSPGGSRPNLANALSAASSIVAQAASPSGSSSSGSSSTSGAAAGGAGAAAAGSAANPIKSPLTAQSYVSFWSKTFPTWVRKMLKQLRRRSLHNSSKRHQAHAQHSAASTVIGQAAQAAASGAVASVVDQAASGGSSSSSSSSSSNSH